MFSNVGGTGRLFVGVDAVGVGEVSAEYIVAGALHLHHLVAAAATLATRPVTVGKQNRNYVTLITI